jgi:hypothetical protein
VSPSQVVKRAEYLPRRVDYITLANCGPSFQNRRERERVRKDSRRVEERKKTYGRGGSERRFTSEGGRNSILLEGTQAMPARPDKDRMGVKTLGWWVVTA